jgi:hypothetical protein
LTILPIKDCRRHAKRLNVTNSPLDPASNFTWGKKEAAQLNVEMGFEIDTQPV